MHVQVLRPAAMGANVGAWAGPLAGAGAGAGARTGTREQCSGASQSLVAAVNSLLGLTVSFTLTRQNYREAYCLKLGVGFESQARSIV